MTNRQKRAREWKKFRKENNLSQARLAQISGIAMSCIKRIEKCKVDPYPITLHRFETLRRRYGAGMETEWQKESWQTP